MPASLLKQSAAARSSGQGLVACWAAGQWRAASFPSKCSLLEWQREARLTLLSQGTQEAEFAGITRAEGTLAKKIPFLPTTTAPFSGTFWTLPLSATTRFYGIDLQSFPLILTIGILLAVYKVFWDVSFIYHCFSLYKYPLWHFEYLEDRWLATMFPLANDINRPICTSSVTQHLTEDEQFSYLGSLCSTVFSSSHMSLTSPFFTLLYETSIMKIKAGGLGGLFFCGKANGTQVDTN